MNKIIRVPYPYLKGKSLATLNNYNKAHWSTQNKIKNAFKEQLAEWFISELKTPYRQLTLVFQLHTPQRRIDATNLALVAKWTEDVLEEKRWVENDKENTIVLKPTIQNKDLIEPLLSVEILTNLQEKNE